MKGSILATAAAFAGAAMADVAHMRRHGHDALHHRGVHSPAPEESCGCTTEVITIYGEPTLVPISTPIHTPTPDTTVTSETTATVHSTSYSTVTVIVTPTPTVPTPGLTSFTETGTFTIPATTITITDTTTVCGATTTELPSGTHTYGGVTTVVETETTIVCPYATVKPSGTTVTSVIETTTYVCPSAGTYTIAPTTTYVPTSTIMVYPTPATYTPGTYTQPGQTVTVTRTDYTYVCPFTNGNEPTSAPPAPVTTTVATTTTTKAPAPPSSTTTSTTPAPTGESGTGTMGMTYSPYTNDNGCKAKADIYSDVAKIKSKGFTHLRVYSTDCNSLEWIGGAASQNGLHLIIGVFISGTGIAGAQQQVTDICNWAQWDLVEMIVVGNEAIQNGFCDAGSLAGFISSSKGAFKAAGYGGKVTTTEPINVWQQYGSALCGSVDLIGANIHPFFNSEVTANKAGEFVQGQIDILEKICPGLDVVNLETGWPSAGSANGLAVPSPSDQKEAIQSLVNTVGAKSVFFSFSDDLWKDPGEFDVEQYWGCIDQF